MSREHAKIEMDLTFGSAKPYGSSRSIVRRIAAKLPIPPCPRVHFQLYPYTTASVSVLNSAGQNGLVASFADVGWINEEKDFTERPRPEVQNGLVFRIQQQQQPLRRQRSLPSLHQGDPAPHSQAVVSNEAIQKISALENELAKLRAQIAQIVQSQEQKANMAAVPTGQTAPQMPLPPPPPPPPPPCPPPGLQRSYSAIDLIKERRGKRTDQQAAVDVGPRQPEIPNMLDVLKDMGKVKLRSVKRLEELQPKPADPNDAAALIAEALKRKFAHRYRNDSQCDKDVSFPGPDLKNNCEAPTVIRTAYAESNRTEEGLKNGSRDTVQVCLGQ
ncbi:mitochondrial fission regulator 1 isoform X2 [Denticeps clupeoides]|uniref:mitochondrial fission regulator 1 isoform X2 n=1 Tax=Denticeps clupeoides TaxID=299321 RepID=UPI0010A4CC01|nr:mitochondrial fission regulator 1 isoform X2 [Denticeps clupeoides]